MGRGRRRPRAGVRRLALPEGFQPATATRLVARRRRPSARCRGPPSPTSRGLSATPVARLSARRCHRSARVGHRRPGCSDGRPSGHRPARPADRRPSPAALSRRRRRWSSRSWPLARPSSTEQGKRAGTGAGMLGGAGVAGAADAWRADRHPDRGCWRPRWRLARGADRHRRLRRRSPACWRCTDTDKIRAATPPATEQTIETVKEDVGWAKTRT